MQIHVTQFGSLWRICSPWGRQLITGSHGQALVAIITSALSHLPVRQGGWQIAIVTSSPELLALIEQTNKQLSPSDPYPVAGDLASNALLWVSARCGITFSGVIGMAKTSASSKSGKAPAKPKAPAKSKAPAEGDLRTCTILDAIQAKYEVIEGEGVRVHALAVLPGIAKVILDLLTADLEALKNIEGMTMQDDSAAEAAAAQAPDEGVDFLGGEEEEDPLEGADFEESAEADESLEAEEGLAEDVDDVGVVDLGEGDDEAGSDLEEEDASLEDDGEELLESEEEEDDAPIVVGDEGEEDEPAVLEGEDDPEVVGDGELDVAKATTKAAPAKSKAAKPAEKPAAKTAAKPATKPATKPAAKGPALSAAQQAKLGEYLEQTRGKLTAYSDAQLQNAVATYLGPDRKAAIAKKATRRDVIEMILEELGDRKTKALLAVK